MVKFSDDQKDFFLEIFNMGMGKSINAISKLSGKEFEIKFNLPSFNNHDGDVFLKNIKQQETKGIIVQKYFGAISGYAFFYYPDVSSKNILKLFIGDEIPVDELERLESDALIEVGNIFINSALSCFSDFLEAEIRTDLPELVYSEKMSALIKPEDNIIQLESVFKIEHLEICGKVSFLLNDESTEILNKKIDEAIG